ncbi:MAG: hypothetical protein JO277_10190 [Candidatus Eremiobacteraeota bacterium]|nr:hypothetical protein [Candidatus Eremiobacteraeota bacterium]
MRNRWWRGAATFLLALACWATTLAAQARADEQLAVGPNPVIDAQLGTGTVTVQTWDRPDVQVGGDGFVTVSHLPPPVVDANLPHNVPGAAHTVQTVHGPVDLPAESFVLPPLQGAQHDAVQVRGNGNTTIMVPRGTALVMAHVETGRVTLNDYHGVFYTDVHNGGVFLNRVVGSGYAESLRGRISATDSTFDRLRARSAVSNITFQNCTSRQIEATSRYGSIVYNDGSFQPGLARFDSEHGNVALGVRGGAQIGAHSENGHVMSSFSDGSDVRGSANTTQARIQGGGPVVTATSGDGSVYLFNGNIREHPSVQAELRGQRFAPAPRTEPAFRAPQPVMRAPSPRTEPAFRAPQPVVRSPQFVPPAPHQQFAPPPAVARPQPRERREPPQDRHPSKPPQ